MSLIIEEEAIDSLPITIDPDIVSGTPVFAGTRVPVEALLDNIAAGVTLDEFLDNFPTVTHAQVLAVLRFSNQTLKKLGQVKRRSSQHHRFPCTSALLVAPRPHQFGHLDEDHPPTLQMPLPAVMCNLPTIFVLGV